MPLPEAGIIFFDLRNLLGSEFNLFFQATFFNLQPAVVDAGWTIADEILMVG